jgi:glycosyltransferase involved in cell wall biosynthesis
LLTVGINAAPLLAPRTGVGRYIAGLLAGLSRLARPPGGPWTFKPLFATQAALAAAEKGRDAPSGGWAPLDVIRRVGKLLPGGYALADATRGFALDALRKGGRLSVYHETNHAAPPFEGPLVLTVHDLSTLRFPETQEPARARHFAEALRERARLAQRVLTPTAAIAREVAAELRLDPSRLRVAHHGVDKRFAPGPREVPRALSAQGVRAPYLLFVGALDGRKGLPELLDAYAALPAAVQREHALVLAGPRGTASDALQAKLRARAGDKLARGDGKLVLLGFQPEAELPALYRGAAALCLPSHYEGFGLPLLEAMACGIPCVASDDPALVEVAGGCALHAPRGDASALAAQLEKALSSAEVRAELSRRGPVHAAQFTWEASALAHVQAYLGALGVESASP